MKKKRMMWVLAAALAVTPLSAQRVTDQLNGKNGTAGLLVNDRALYDNLNATMRSADSLLIDLKSHPKRYVHFSLFGRK